MIPIMSNPPKKWAEKAVKCDAIEQNESEVENMIFIFLTFLIRVLFSFDLVKTPWRLDNRFLRYKHMNNFTNNKKKNQLALFGCILKLVFASFSSFCKNASQIQFGLNSTAFMYTLYLVYTASSKQ